MPILNAYGLEKAYGAKVLFTGIDVTVVRGSRVGVIGRNGTGKSSLLRVLAGREPPDVGRIELRRGARVGMFDQNPVLPEGKTARDVIVSGLHEWHTRMREYEELTAKLTDHPTEANIDAHAELGAQIEELGGFDRDHEINDVATRLGVPSLDRDVASLSGGEARRVALARLLVERPELLILDEPTNHLDADTIAWLETFLQNTYKGSVIMVTHDRQFLDSVCDRIFELEHGHMTEFVGNYSHYLEAKSELVEREAAAEDKRQNWLRNEKKWLLRGAKARTTKQKARIQRAEAEIAKTGPKAVVETKLGADVSRLGATILDLENVSVDMGERTLFRDLTLQMVSGERICIVGPNGTGKTTLLRVALGEQPPTSGKAKLGKNTQVAYFDQGRSDLNDDWTVFENVAGFAGAEVRGAGYVELGGETLGMHGYLERFAFDGHMQRQKVSSLSGGERARVALAKMLKSAANLLVFDEPTNDLDVQTLSSLEEMLETWKGCALVVSHDRWFMNRVATGILAFERDPSDATAPAKVTLHQGDYETYAERRRAAETDRRNEASSARGRAQQQARASQAPTATSASTVPAKAAAPAKSLLTYKERLELEGIMARIEAAEARVTLLQTKLASPALYAEGGVKVTEMRASLESAENEARTLTARWEALEAKNAGA